MMGNFSLFFYRLQIFFNITFFKIFSDDNVRVSNSLNSDQALHSIGPDLGPNCVQRSSTDDKIYHLQTKS